MEAMRHNNSHSTEKDKKRDHEEVVVAVEGGVEINAAGHRDQLKRQYNLWALAGIALTIDNAWLALGSSIAVSIANGGPTGLIYGLIVATFIGLSLAELASSVPTAGGVYHWATIAAGPRWGRMTGFFAGWINFYGWLFGLASLQQVTANVAVQMYATYHRDTYAPAAWHVYVTYVVVLWLGTACVILANRRAVPWTQHLGMVLVVVGGVVTIAVVAALPERHASNTFVWASFEENNFTGWSGGVAFMLGVLNGAFTVGTPDAITHLAEELPHPRRDLPTVIGLQIGLGGFFAFVFAIAIGYAITDLPALIEPGNLNTYPLAIIYEQATGSAGGTLGLLLILLLSSICCNVGTLLTCSRAYWALARDRAVPFSGFFARVDEDRSCPVPATLFVSVVATGLGAIALGSNTAFLDLSGSFVVLTTFSYAIPFVANMATGRRYFPEGRSIWVGEPAFAIPTTKESMNYNSVILVGSVALSAVWWAVHATRHYPGPKVMRLYIHDDAAPWSHGQDVGVLSSPIAGEKQL
ncbi:Choline transport protein [Apiospora kogelbergensis]|uniref:Choline transport protein n=1 Tax=Apiospora kogelbergensis TaxID=1337665 RepID=A0AAW0RCA8_9PEZI